jgi:hypothetical protein
MGRATHIKVSGNWKEVVNIWRKVSGVWQDEVMSWYNAGGTPKKCMLYSPAAPVSAPSAAQPDMGGSINTSWPAITDATYYKLYRKPYHNGLTWVNDYEEQYNGPLTTYVDSIQDEVRPADATTIYYKYTAGNAKGDSDLSPEGSVVWYEL